ncbi:hypothetical protein RSAG8_06116, partial [Rhizoctonia solani AG-8 WAC10335]
MSPNGQVWLAVKKPPYTSRMISTILILVYCNRVPFCCHIGIFLLEQQTA